MDTIQLGPWQFSAADFSITDETQRKELEPLLCKMLSFFAENPERIVSRQELIDAIWQQSFVDDNAINRAISELRKVLQHPTLKQSPIKTHHRKGYSLQLTAVNDSPSNTFQALPATSNTSSLTRRKVIYLLPVFVTLLAGVIGYWQFGHAVTDQSISSDITASQTNTYTLSLPTKQKVTWFKGVESRPLLSPTKKLLAYSHSQADGSMRVIVRKAALSVTGQALHEVAIESAERHYVAHSWQPQTQRLLLQSVKKDGQQCQYLAYDFDSFPQYKVSTVSQCSGFTLGNAQLSIDGKWLYRSETVAGIYTSSALVSENLITSDSQTLAAAPTAGLGVTMLALSEDGSKLAYLFTPESNKPELFIYTPATREHQRVMAFPAPALLMGLEWSSDQSLLFIPAGDAILKLDIANKKLTTMMLPDGAVVGEMSLASDNTAFTSSMSPGAVSKNAMQMVKVINPFDEQQRQFTPVHDAEGSTISPAFSPTEPNVYAFAANWSGSWQLWLHDNGNNKQLTEFSEGKTPLNGASWSGDGRYIAFIKGGNLFLYDVQRKQLIDKLNNQDAGQPVWLPDNSGIVLTRLQADSQDLWQLDLMSNSMTQLTYGGAGHPQFTQSGELLYSRDGKLMRYIDGKRADIEMLDADESALDMMPSLINNNEQWRFGMLGHIQRRSLSGQVLQQTQLPFQLIGVHFNPHSLDELYLTVFVTPEMALEFIEWEVL